MSAPDTNTENEERKHRHSLFGIKASIVYGVGLLALFTIFVISASDDEDAGIAGDDSAGSSISAGATDASVLDGYKADGYEPGGNSTGTVTLQDGASD